MPSLWDELHPLALQVEEARSKVVDAAREHMCGDIDTGGLKTAVQALDKAQMALGLRTAQLLLSTQPEQVRVAAPHLPVTVGGLEPQPAEPDDPGEWALSPVAPSGAPSGVGPPPEPPVKQAGAGKAAAWGKGRGITLGPGRG